MEDDILSLKKQLLEKDAEIAALKKKLEQTQKVSLVFMCHVQP